MAFVLELQSTSSQPYIKNYIISIIRRFGIPAAVRQAEGKIISAFASEHPKLGACLEAIAQELPASCFLTGSSHYTIEGEPESVPEFKSNYPLGLGLCPACQKELFDPASRRYYYPFSSCSHCGGQYSFFQGYPFKRDNTLFKFIQPCSDCESETTTLGIKEQHQLNSCHSCGIAVRMRSKNSERYANDAGSFRTMFEVAAKALVDNKRLLMKTSMGYKLFYQTSQMQAESIVMMLNAAKITDYLSLIEAEFNALLSIERPILHAAVQDTVLEKR